MCGADKGAIAKHSVQVVHAEAPVPRAPPIPMLIIADRCCARKRGGASACADIEQNRVRNAIVPGSRYHCAASLQKNIRRMVNAATKSSATLPWQSRYWFSICGGPLGGNSARAHPAALGIA